MKNNETCNSPKCMKPSGLIDGINCRLCNGWVHIKCANLSRTEARSLAKFKSSRCFLVNTIPQCQDDNFRPDSLFISGVRLFFSSKPYCTSNFYFIPLFHSRSIIFFSNQKSACDFGPSGEARMISSSFFGVLIPGQSV